MLAILWGVALAGVFLKALFFHELFEGAGRSLYLGLGWLGVITLGKPSWERGVRFATPLVTGGMASSVGGVISSTGFAVPSKIDCAFRLHVVGRDEVPAQHPRDPCGLGLGLGLGGGGEGREAGLAEGARLSGLAGREANPPPEWRFGEPARRGGAPR